MIYGSLSLMLQQNSVLMLLLINMAAACFNGALIIQRERVKKDLSRKSANMAWIWLKTHMGNSNFLFSSIYVCFHNNRELIDPVVILDLVEKTTVQSPATAIRSGLKSLDARTYLRIGLVGPVDRILAVKTKNCMMFSKAILESL